MIWCFSSARTPSCAATSAARSRTSIDLDDSFACPLSTRDSVRSRSDEARQPIRFLEHAADDLAVGALVAPLAQPDLADAPNRRQRRPQLVRHIGCEPLHLPERRLEPAERVVEHRCETAELVVRVVDRQPFAQAIGGDRTRALRHPFDRRQRVARHGVSAEPGDGAPPAAARAARNSSSSRSSDPHRRLRTCAT